MTLPTDVQTICQRFVRSLNTIFGDKLYGIYMYGATVFPDAGRIQDIDCHVILRTIPTLNENEQVFRLYDELAEQLPPLGGEVDAYFITLEDARGSEPPRHHLRPEMWDNSWALHCAHIRAGRYLTLYGAEPDDIFPAPSWEAVAAALENELDYVSRNLHYPAYCVLNLCRIWYSFLHGNVVVSKRFSGQWAIEQFPAFAPLVMAAMKGYEGRATPEEERLLQAEVGNFFTFISGQLHQIRGG